MASTSSQSFVQATSLCEEVKLTLIRFQLMSIQNVAEIGTFVIPILFVGQLPNSAVYLSGVGFARSFVNVTAIAMAWGFTTALFTLLPQAIGAGQTRLVAIYTQRAFYIVTVVSALLCIVQIFAGDIMIAIGQPVEIQSIVNVYCRLLIPNILLTAYATVLQRLIQALDLNAAAMWSSLLVFIFSPLFTWFFMYYLGCGYWGAAIAQNISMAVFLLSEVAIVIHKGHAHVFIALPLRLVCTSKGMREYVALAMPGLLQGAFEWIMQEIAIILAGYVVQSTIALSTTVIVNSLYMFCIAFSFGICNAVNMRVGKYIGSGNIKDAQRAMCVGVTIAIVLGTVFAMIFVLGRKTIPQWFTDNQQTLWLSSKIMCVLAAYSWATIMTMTLNGIYRALGLQKMTAIFMFVSYWLISFPSSLVLLFAVGLKHDLLYGTLTIWAGTLVMGNILACIAQSVYLALCTDWIRAVVHSQSRIEGTLRESQEQDHSKQNLSENEVLLEA